MTTTPPDPQVPSPAAASWRDFWRTWVLGALLPVYLLTTFGATLARVSGESMAPTLHSGQLLLLRKYPRWLHAWRLTPPYLRRGDVVVFKIPQGSPYAFETLYGLRHRPYNVKRVVALAGDTVRIQDGQLIVNGRPVAESYASPEGYMNGQPEQLVPAGKVWVLGDNRRLGDSLDSRAYGPVDIRDVAGTANVRLWPKPGSVRP